MLSDSSLSASDGENDDLLTELRINDAHDQQTETDIMKDIELTKTLMPKVMETLSKTGMHEVLVSFLKWLLRRHFHKTT